MPALKVLLAGAALLAAGPHDVPDRDDLLTAINAMRADPPAYAASLAALEALFDTPAARNYRIPGEPFGRITREGVGAVQDARRALSGHMPLGPLEPSRLLRDAARDHAEEQEGGALGHFGPHGETPGTRVKRRGGDIYVAEVISYGAVDADDALRQLMVDDGVPGRGHRTLLLSGAYRYAGIWCGRHATYRTVCVADLAQTADGSPKLPETR